MSAGAVAELLQSIQAASALAGAVFAALAFWYGRRNHALGKANADALNGQGKRLEGIARAQGYQQGVIDQAGGVAPGPYPPEPPKV